MAYSESLPLAGKGCWAFGVSSEGGRHSESIIIQTLYFEIPVLQERIPVDSEKGQLVFIFVSKK